MSNYLPDDLMKDILPDDLMEKIVPDVYKINLPKVNIKKPKNKKEKEKLLKKLQQICDYQPYDKQSRINKINHLVKIFKVFLIDKIDLKNQDFVDVNQDKLKKLIKNTSDLLSSLDKLYILNNLIWKNDKIYNEQNLLTDSFKNIFIQIIDKQNSLKQLLTIIGVLYPEKYCESMDIYIENYPELYKMCYEYEPPDDESKRDRGIYITEHYINWLKTKEKLDINKNDNLELVLGEIQALLNNPETIYVIYEFNLNKKFNIDKLFLRVFRKLHIQLLVISNDDIHDYLFYICDKYPDKVCKKIVEWMS